jgi:hypothetical protein
MAMAIDLIAGRIPVPIFGRTASAAVRPPPGDFDLSTSIRCFRISEEAHDRWLTGSDGYSVRRGYCLRRRGTGMH